MSQSEYNASLKPDLGILFAQYYLFVKKQKRDIEYHKEFDEKELHDLQYTILLLLNHIGTDGDQNPLESENIKLTLERTDINHVPEAEPVNTENLADNIPSIVDDIMETNQ
jgi:hypothetical protein